MLTIVLSPNSTSRVGTVVTITRTRLLSDELSRAMLTELKCSTLLPTSCCTQCGPLPKGISITWELVRTSDPSPDLVHQEPQVMHIPFKIPEAQLCTPGSAMILSTGIPQGSFKSTDFWVPFSFLNSNLVGLGCNLGTGVFQSSSCGFNIQQS